MLPIRFARAFVLSLAGSSDKLMVHKETAMIVEVPILYSVEYKRPRSGTVRSADIASTHFVDIPEVLDAALVAEIDADGWLADDDGALPRHKVYHIDGEFWATTFVDDRGDRSREIVTTDTYKEAVRGPREAVLPGMPIIGSRPALWMKKGEHYYDSEEDIMAKVILSSKRDDACADAAARAADLRVFDGMVLRRASEPVYQTKWLGSDELYVRHRFLHQVIADQAHMASADYLHVWRLDQFDAMVERLEAIRVAANHSRLRAVEVHRPDLLSYDRWQLLTVSQFNRDLKNYRERHAFDEDSVERFSAFAALRDKGELADDASRESIAESIRLALRLHMALGISPDVHGPFDSSIRHHESMVEDDLRRSEQMDSIGTGFGL